MVNLYSASLFDRYRVTVCGFRAVSIGVIFLMMSACASSRPEKLTVIDAPQTEVVEEDPLERAIALDEIGTDFTTEDDAASAIVSEEVNRRIQAALQLFDDGDSEQCMAILGELVKEKQGGFLASYNLGVIFERAGEYERAAYRYVQALQSNSDFTPALLNLVRLYLRNNMPQEAEDIVVRFVDLRPENLEHQAVRLEIVLSQGRYEDVVQRARDILRKDERHVEAMIYMARANLFLERYELARAILNSALRLSPNRADIFYFYGLIELQSGNSPGATANFRRAVRLQPRYPEARNNLGVLYHEANDSESAVEHLLAAIDDYPDFKEAHLNLGNAYKSLSKFKDAERSFLNAIALDDDYIDAHFNIGILYLESEIPELDTIERLQKSIASFNSYMQAARGQLPKDDPATNYIREANQAIELTKQRMEMQRRAQMQAAEAAAQPSPDDDQDDEWGDSESYDEEDDWEESGVEDASTNSEEVVDEESMPVESEDAAWSDEPDSSDTDDDWYE